MPKAQSEGVLQVDRDVQSHLLRGIRIGLDALLREEQRGIHAQTHHGDGQLGHRTDEETGHLVFVTFVKVDFRHVHATFHTPLDELGAGCCRSHQQAAYGYRQHSKYFLHNSFLF